MLWYCSFVHSWVESHIEFKPATPGPLGANNPHLLISVLPLHCGLLLNSSPISSWFILIQLIRIFCFNNLTLLVSSVHLVPYSGWTLMDRYLVGGQRYGSKPHLCYRIRSQPAGLKSSSMTFGWCSTASSLIDGLWQSQVVLAQQLHWNVSSFLKA